MIPARREVWALSPLLLPNEILSMSAQAARRLVEAGDGDAALLYLALLEGRGRAESPTKRLGWIQPRLEQAWRRLEALGLVAGEPIPSGQATGTEPGGDSPLPEYSRKDLADAMDTEPDFRGLYQEMERIMGRQMTDNDLKCLYTIYDYLALPPEVILLLAGCVTRRLRRRKNNPGLRPRMPQIQKEAFRWKRLGVETVERAEDYLRRQEQIDRREWKILSLIGVTTPRAAVEREREYIERWVEMGLSDELIALAYERTVFQKKEMNWAYMNKILTSWHQAGYDTVERVQAEDRPPQRGRQERRQAQAKDFQPSAERIRRNADWLDQFLEGQEKGG